MNKKQISNQRSLTILLVLLLTATAVYVLRSVLLPFVVGIVVAYFLDPLVNKICGSGKISRTVATVIVMSLFLLILLPLLVLLGGSVISQLSDFFTGLPQHISQFGTKLTTVTRRLQTYFPALAFENIEASLKENFGDSLKPAIKVVRGLISNGFAFVNVISLLLISPVVAFYMLRDWPEFTQKSLNLIPQKHQPLVIDGVNQVNRIISGYLRGQCLVCLSLGCFYAFGLWLVNLKLGVLVGFLAGLISFIPYVGSISGFLIAIVLVVTQYGTLPKLLAVIAVFAVGQFLEGNVLTPKLVGENLGLHPVWVMFALLSGGVLLGFLGMIIAVPVAACIGVFLRYVIGSYKQSPIYLEK